MGLPSEIHPFHIAGGGNQYKVTNSLRFRSSASGTLTRTPSVAGNRQKFTLSTWLKRGTLSLNQAIFSASDGTQNNEFLLFFGSGNGDTISIQQTVASTSSGQISCISNAVFRDPSAWYHIVLAIDTTQATSTNRLFLYVNGVAQTFSTYSVGSSINTWVNNTNTHAISKRADASLYFDGYQAEINFVDGQQLDSSYFGQTDSITGVWQPKKYTGTYGTNGFYLPFNDATSTTTIGYDRQLGLTDSSKNNWTASGISVTNDYTYDVMRDSPTNYNDGSTYYNRGNYPTLNPVYNPNTMTLTAGNLGFYKTSVSASVPATINVTSGKWYFECGYISDTSGGYGIGAGPLSTFPFSSYLGSVSNSCSVWKGTGGTTIYLNGTTNTSLSITAGDTMIFALDCDNGKMWSGFYKVSTATTYWFNSSGGTTGDPSTGANPSVTFTAGTVMAPGASFTSSGTYQYINFGQRSFTLTPPSGFTALNTYNLPNPSLPLV